MKSFADNAFYLLFDQIVRRDKPKDNPDVWTSRGVTWRHSRHSFETQSYGFTIELYELASSGKSGWSLLVAKEHWWGGRQGEVLRSTHWAKPIRGSRTAIIAWLKEQQRQVDAEYDQDRFDQARAR
jgi:hypothetical protein